MIHLILPSGAGKTNPTLASLTQSATVSIVHVASRTEVEHLDAGRFLSSFSPSINREELSRLRGRVHFTVDGYDGCEEEIYAIPEIREYYAHLNLNQPGWLFFAHRSHGFRALMLCLLPNIRILRRGRQVRVSVLGSELKEFFLNALPAAAHLNSLAGLSNAQSCEELQRVAASLCIGDDT